MNESQVIARLKTLERQNHYMKFMLFSLAVFVVLANVTSFVRASSDDMKVHTVTAETFILVDSQGNAKGRWYIKDRLPILEMQTKHRKIILGPAELAIYNLPKNPTSDDLAPRVWLAYSCKAFKGCTGRLLLFNDKHIGREIEPEWTK